MNDDSTQTVHGYNTSLKRQPDTHWSEGFGLTPEPWTKDAACREVDPDMFFPDSKAASGVIPEAKKICAGCDVAAQCLAYAIRNGEQHGVWGGLTGQELQALKTRQQPRLSPPCNTTGCDKPRFSRGMCQPHYRAWLEVQASDEARKQAVS